MMQRIFSCGLLSSPALVVDFGRLQWYSAALKHWALAAALLALTNVAIATESQAEGAEPDRRLGGIAAKFWPWGGNESQDGSDLTIPPPEFTPYRLPTLDGQDTHYNDDIAPLVKAPQINADVVLASVLRCYPAKSHWQIDVNLRGQIRNNPGLETDDTGNTQIGSNYVAIVAQMPLYSGAELDKRREREYHRRTDMAGLVAEFVAAIASRNHAIRELALYRSLEARARTRVQQGIVPVAEQVKYLEKVASSQENLIKHETKIMESRIKMAATCEPRKHDPMNNYLMRISTVPGTSNAYRHNSGENQAMNQR